MDIRRYRQGFTLIELLVVVAIIALLISILLPSLARARELAKRAVSRANARGIGQAAYIYSNDNTDKFPRLRAQLTTGADQRLTGVDYIQAIGDDRITSRIGENTGEWNNRSNMPVSRSLFLLVIGGATAPKQFINPSAADQPDDLRNESGTQERAANPGVDRFDFKGYDRFSYGYQHPYNTKARPDTDMDVRMALAADKGPWFTSGTGTTGTFTWAGSQAVSTNPSDDPMENINNLEDLLARSNDDWRPYNSQNHNGEGQSVLFVDGHVDFENKPIVGPNQDNIYTPNSESTVAAIGNDNDSILTFMKGSRIEGNGNTITTLYGPLTSTDSFIIP